MFPDPSLSCTNHGVGSGNETNTMQGHMAWSATSSYAYLIEHIRSTFDTSCTPTSILDKHSIVDQLWLLYSVTWRTNHF